jgi:DNA-binding transcriptional regulator YhcF (GntR family)
MIIQIDFASEIAIYTQLKQQIIEAIANGTLRPGEALPSVRQLAGDIGVNMHTVNKAYTQLKQEGYTLIHKRQGVLVKSKDEMRDPAFQETLHERIRPLIAESICKGVTQEEFLAKCRKLFEEIHKEQV